MYRVLIADDEPIERMVISKKIKQFFPDLVEITLAENGKEAVELFEKSPFPVVVLDISMPGMNGLDAAAAIRAQDARCSIIFLTAYDDFSYAKKAIGLKALDYLLKPADEKELIPVLEEAFSLADAAQKYEEQLRNSTGVTQNSTGLTQNSTGVTQNSTGLTHNSTGIPQNSTALTQNTAEPTQDSTKLTHTRIESDSEQVKLNAVMEEIRRYLEAHYREDISLQDAAGAIGYSDAYFSKLFKQCFDRNFISYLNDLRMEKALALLNDITVSIKDISAEAGYRDANYFARLFKRRMGMSPRDYRIEVLREKQKPQPDMDM